MYDESAMESIMDITNEGEAKNVKEKEKSLQDDSMIRELPQNIDTENKTEDKGVKTNEISKADLAELSDVETEEVPAASEETEILAFKVADEEYAVRITEIQEIIKYQRITKVPCSPKYLLGLTSLRGNILPVIDLKIRLGFADERAEKQKIIILSGEKETLGVLVSSVLGVFRFSENEFLPPPSTLKEEKKGFIEGIVKIDNKLISVLNVTEITKIEV